MAIAEIAAARKLIRGGAGGTMARGPADAGGGISFGLEGAWQPATNFLAGIFDQDSAALAGAAHELVLRLGALWQCLLPTAADALQFLLGVAAVLLLVAVVWFSVLTLAPVIVECCKALVYALSYLGRGVFHVAAAVARALSWLLRPCVQWVPFYVVDSMEAPGAAGAMISRTAFEAAPALYFQILRAAGPVVAAAVFCTRTVAWAVARPVAALFRVSFS